MYEKENKLMARECGLVEGTQTYWLFDKHGHNSGFKVKTWTIKDARCREIIREKYIIDSISGDNNWSCMSVKTGDEGIGKDESAAFIACIVEICKGIE